MNVHFKTELKSCPVCSSTLTPYATMRRTVVSQEYGRFTAIVHLMKCPEDNKIFRPGSLNRIVNPYCTYANDVMVDAAVKRFIDGRSCSEISSSFDNGISERHVRSVSNMALSIFGEIHEESIPKLRESMHSWILQIDGTTDSEFSMIVTVMDASSGFVLYAKKCSSESQENVEDVLKRIEEMFGTPSGTICDMSDGTLSAARAVFPDVPTRICLMHFLRDLGKDILKNMHTDLGTMITRIGIKSPLKAVLRSIPDYSQRTLDEIYYGFCSDRKEMEIMAVRRVIEKVVSMKGSSGYGFPFSLQHLNFFVACEEAEKKLSDLVPMMKERESLALTSIVEHHISRVTGNEAIRETANKLRDINSLIFKSIRSAFLMPDKGRLSEEVSDFPDYVIRERCEIVFGQLDVYLRADIPWHLFSAAKIAIERYHNRVEMLFANNTDHTIPRTNNGIERFFRKMRRNVRKRCGNLATGKILTHSGEPLALFQNMSNERYREIVFGSEDIPQVFAKHRKQFRKVGMTRKWIVQLVDKGTDMIIRDSLPDSPYTKDGMGSAYSNTLFPP